MMIDMMIIIQGSQLVVLTRVDACDNISINIFIYIFTIIDILVFSSCGTPHQKRKGL